MVESEKPSVEPEFDMEKVLDGIAKSVHSSEVMWIGALLDEALEQVLVDHMHGISNTLRERLFEGYGPLATFSSKIDVAFALGYISARLRTDITSIKSVRNKFAHTTERFDFNTPAIISLLSNFRDYDREKDPRTFFQERFLECYGELLEKHTLGRLARALMAAQKGPGLINSGATLAFPEKSE